MSARSIRFHCPRCQVPIKAPIQLAGQIRSCPGCERLVKVPPVMRAAPVAELVLVEGKERFAWRLRCRGSVPVTLVSSTSFLSEK